MRTITKIILISVAVMIAGTLIARPVSSESKQGGAQGTRSVPNAEENIKRIQQGRFGLNRVAQLVGIAKDCHEDENNSNRRDKILDLMLTALGFLQIILGKYQTGYTE